MNLEDRVKDIKQICEECNVEMEKNGLPTITSIYGKVESLKQGYHCNNLKCDVIHKSIMYSIKEGEE